MRRSTQLCTAVLLATVGLVLVAVAFADPPGAPTAIDISGGSAGAAQNLPAGQARFGLRVPLKPNAENTLTVGATSAAQTVTSQPFVITQLSLGTIVTAQVTATRLSVDEVKQLVAQGTINVSDPANFNVSRFDIVLTVGGMEVPVSVPIVKDVADPFGAGQMITIGCAPPGQGLKTTDRAIAIPCGGGGGGSPPNVPDTEIIPFTIDVPGLPAVPSIPGVIVIEGKIKTLKEFFKVNLLLSNVSDVFTLSDITATIQVPPDALTPILPASGPIMLPDLPPHTQQTGQFIVRGDQIGLHTVTVSFGGNLSGLGLAQPVPVSGSASTDLEVKGPPTLGVTVTHPDFVTGGVPYTLMVDIKNTSPDVPALFASLALDVGADAKLLDPMTGMPLAGPETVSLGDLLPGQHVTESFQVLPLATGPITSCTAGTSENISLTVVFTNGGPHCAIGTFPSDRAGAGPGATVTIVPPNNTTDVAVIAPVTMLFSTQMATETITTGFPGATVLLTDANGQIVPGFFQFGAFGSGNTIAILHPSSPLAFATQYTVTVLQTIFDMNGFQLASGRVARFTTEGTPLAPDTTPPQATIAIQPPVNPSAVLQGQMVTIQADGTDDVGVVRIDLLLDGALVDSQKPPTPVHFMLDTSHLMPGSTHTLTARAVDAAGNPGTADTSLTMFADTTPPTVQIASPGQEPRGRKLPITITAADDGHVARVDLFLDGGASPVFTGTIAPFLFSLATSGLAPGPHALHAVATDGAGNTAAADKSVQVIDDTQPPVVVITTPVAGAQVRQGPPLAVTAIVTDNVGVGHVQFFLDAEAMPRAVDAGGFILDTTMIALGPHMVTVMAQDLAGNPAQAAVAFTLFTVPPDTTPPAAPDASKITVTPPVNALAMLIGVVGAVEANAQVQVTNLRDQTVAVMLAAGDGSFQLKIEAAAGDTLAVVAIDAASNQSVPTNVVVPPPPQLVSVSVMPPSVTLGRTNPSQQLTVVGTFTDMSQATLTTGVTFTSDSPATATVNPGGLVLPGQNGMTTVHVQVAPLPMVDVPVTVAFPTITSVIVQPSSVHLLDLGRTQLLAVVAILSDASMQPFAGAVTFGSDDPTIAGVDSSGLVTGVGEGMTTVTAAPAGFPPVPVPVTVEKKHLVSISPSPGSITLVGAGQMQAITVSGNFSDGSSAPITTGIGFLSADGTIATVDANGVVTSVGNGTTHVTVSVAGVPSADVPVTVKSFNGISVSPPSFTLIGTGKTKSLTVTGSFTDGSSTTLTSGVTFGSDKTAVATVDPASGLVTSTGLGSATITATFLTFSSQATVTVIARQATGLAASPSSLLLTAASQQVQLQIQVTFNDNTTGPPTDPVNFTSLDTTVVKAGATGIVTAVANGSTQVNVTSGPLSTSVPVTVAIPVANPPPHIDALDRPRAGEGDPFTIRGSNFAAVPSDDLVTINGVAATVQAARQDELTVLVPLGATSGPVVVTVASQASNAVPLDVYARQAQSRSVTAPVDLPASPGDMATFNVASITVEAGDLVVLSSAPDVLAPLDFTGTLTASVDGGPAFGLATGTFPDLTAHFAPGTHSLSLTLTATGSTLHSGPIFLVVGPAGTGPIAGARSVVALAQSHPIPVTFLDLTDLSGNPLPDGAQVAVTAQQIGVVTRDGRFFVTSAGGTILNGTPAPNDGRFQTLTVVGGRIDVMYDPGPLALATAQSGVANIQVLPADASGNVGAFQAIAVEPVTLTTFDTAATPRSQSSVVADGLAKTVTVTLRGIRDTAGTLVPDGTQVAVTVQQIGVVTPDGCCFVTSAGGSITNGVATPNDGRFQTFTVTGGQVVIAYDPSPIELGTADVRTTNFQVLPADASGNRIGSRAFSVTPLTLSSPSAQPANVDVSPTSVLADNADNRAVITLTHIVDTLGSPVPDGTQVAVTVQQIGVVTPDNCCFVNSAGGTIVGGALTPNDGRFRTFTVTGGAVQVVYSSVGVSVGVRQSATARVQILPADAGGNRIGSRAFAVADVTLTGYETATATVVPTSVVADGLPKTVTITLTGILDTAGNPVPDGSNVAVTAGQIGVVTPDNCCFVNSRGGTITNGTVTPNDGRFRTLPVSGGQVVIDYDPSPVELQAADVQTANIQVLPADASGNVLGSRAFTVAPVTLSSPTAQPMHVVATPPSVLADDADNHVIVTVSNITDALGRPVPDGTKVAATVRQIGVVTPDGCCFVNSAGGTVVGGTTAANDGRFSVFTVTGGQVQIVYSTLGVEVGVRQPATATMQILPADPSNNVLGSRAFAVAPITLAAYQDADVIGAGTVAPGGTATYVVQNIVDTSGNPVPDGAKIAITVQQIGVVSPDGCCFVNSAGGTITNGGPSPSDGRFVSFTVQNGSLSIDFQAPAQAGVTSTLQLLPAEPSGNRIDGRAFAVKAIAIGP